MPECCRAGQFLVWVHPPEERLCRRWEWRLLGFVAPAALRPSRANGYLSKSREQEGRARRPRQGSRFGAALRAQSEIHPDSVAWFAVRSFLVLEYSSHLPRSVSFVFL